MNILIGGRHIEVKCSVLLRRPIAMSVWDLFNIQNFVHLQFLTFVIPPLKEVAPHLEDFLAGDLMSINLKG